MTQMTRVVVVVMARQDRMVLWITVAQCHLHQAHYSVLRGWSEPAPARV